jgi:ankyrin repeat protein
MSNGIGPQHPIFAGQFNESPKANQGEKEPSALSHFLLLRRGSTALKAITPLTKACIPRLNPNSNPSKSYVNVSLADLRKSYPDLAIINPCWSRGRVVVSASEIGRYDILKGLLRNGQIVSDEHRGRAVMKAAFYGYHDIVATLLQNGQISEDHRGTAVVHAALYGRVQVIEMLLQKGSISKDDRGRAVVNAAENGHLYVIDMLLQNGAQISDEHRGWAVMNAAENGNVQVIDTLLQNGAQISYDHRGWAVMHAVEYGDVQIIDTLLQNGAQIRWDHRGEAVKSAVRSGRVQVIEMLLRNGQISGEHRGTAVMNAAQFGRVDIIERLLQDGAGAGIPLHHLHQAIWFLNERQLVLPALNALVNDAPQPNDYRHGINVHAGSRDNKTRAALELLWERTNGLEIQEPYQNCISYLQDLPESDKKTLALRALLEPKVHPYDFPPLLDEEGFSCNGFSLTGKELIGRLWGFISGCDEKNQDECKEGMLTALSKSFEGKNLVCNQGKTQRLLIAVLQGRLEGVQIDDLAPVLTPDQAVRLFFEDERRQGIENREELLREANRFLEENPIVHRESFMAKLEEFLNLREPAQDE